MARSAGRVRVRAGWILIALLGWAGAANAASAGRTILGIGSFWRVFEMKGDKVVPLKLLKATDPKASGPQTFGPGISTDPPPPGWQQPDFDDASWFRAPGALRGANAALLCARGKFTVQNPKRVRRLTLSLRYRGGVVVYLNGREVLRRNLPAGRLGPSTPAQPYPRDAYVDGRGKLLPAGYHIGQRVRKGEKDLPGRVARRDRSSGAVELPLGRLRKGMNVLAVEVHRSAFRPEGRTLFTNRRLRRGAWAHIGLSRLHLVAEGAVAPNVARPDGLQVWNQDIHRVFDIRDYGDPHEPLRPIRLVGARNGVYSGQVVVSSTAPIKGLRATVTGLKRDRGRRAIPASAARVRYMRLTTLGTTGNHDGLALANWDRVPAFSPLSSTPPAMVKTATLPTRPSLRAALGLPPKMRPAAVQPIWVTVHVPKNAPAGRYKGSLMISARGAPATRVPIELDVIDWTLPDPRDYRTFVSVYQSPESVAIQYKVPMWSERHWALLEKSFELLGYLSNRLLVIPLVNRTEYGNDESRVPWIKQRDGTYKFGLTVHDRLIRLAQKHCRLKVISYQVYRSNGWGPPPPTKPTFVTVVNPGSRRAVPMKLPAFGTPESKRLWQPLINELRKRFARGGIAEGARPILGIGHDGGTNRTVVAHFRDMWPAARWQYGGHSRPRPTSSRGRYMGYIEYLYVAHSIPSPTRSRRRGWAMDSRNVFLVMSQRIRDNAQPPIVMRTMGERALLLGDMGVGKMCLDYWPVAGSARVMNRCLYSRWPESSARQRSPHLCYMGSPAPNGAIATFKLEALREGLQEAEARIFLEEALVRRRITGALARRCQALLDRRTELCRIAHGNHQPMRSTYNQGWQRRSADVYRLAAEVARVLRSR